MKIKNMHIWVGLLISIVVMEIKGGSDQKSSIQHVVQNLKDAKLFEYIPHRKEYIVAYYDAIYSKNVDNESELHLFTCEKEDRIRNVQYRVEHDDLVVATNRNFFLYSLMAKKVQKELYRLPYNDYTRSIKQLPDNRILMMTSGHIVYWDLASHKNHIWPNRNFKFISEGMNKRALFFFNQQNLMVYDVITGRNSFIPVKDSIKSAICNNEKLYIMTDHSILQYDLRDLCAQPNRPVSMPYDSLRSFSCNNDGTKLLMITEEEEVILHDINAKQQTILNADSDHIWSVCFYDKDDNQYIVRTSDGIELRNTLTNTAKILFKKEKEENALFTVYHNKKRDELLITTMRRAIIVSLKNQESYELETLSDDDDHIGTAQYDDSDDYIQISSIKGRHAIHNVVDLKALKRLEFEDSHTVQMPSVEVDLSMTVGQFNQSELKEADQSVSLDHVDEYEELFEKHQAKDSPSQSNKYHILITGCITLASWIMSSWASY